MTDETLTKTLAGLRDDIDMLLNTHYSASPDGIAGMKTRIASAIANIDTLTKNLSETNTKLAQDEQTLSECKFFDDYMTQQIIPQYREDSLSLFNLYRDIREFLNEFLTNEEAADAIELYQKNDLWEPYLKQLRQILDILSVQDAQDLKNMLSSGSTGGSTVSTELQEQVETNTTNITELQSKVNANTTNLGTLQTQVDANTTNITSLQTQANTFATDIASMQTQVDTNTTNITTLQGKVTTLENQVAKYLTPPDPNYTGKTFTDYPAGTIIQTYDCDERKYIKSTNTLLTTPLIYFCAEIGSTGKCKITHTFALQNTANLCFKTYLNDSLIDERVIAVTASTESQNISYEVFDLPLNATTKANKIYTTILSQGSPSSNVISYTKLKTEITASNVVILNKIRPFDAIQIHDKYYLNDCTTGYLRTCEISTDKIFKTSDIVWESTDIEAESCITTCDKVQYVYNFQQGNNIYKFRKDSNSKIYMGQKEDNYSQYMSSRTADSSLDSIFTSDLKIPCVMENDKRYFIVYLENGNIYQNSPETINFVKFRGVKIHNQSVADSFCVHGVYITPDGKVMIKRKGASYSPFEIGQGSDANIYLENYNGTYNYTFNVYVKYFDKIILYKITFKNNTFTITDTIEMGSYDAFYEMENNKYFVVKNNQLQYYSKESN